MPDWYVWSETSSTWWRLYKCWYSYFDIMVQDKTCTLKQKMTAIGIWKRALHFLSTWIKNLICMTKSHLKWWVCQLSDALMRGRFWYAGHNFTLYYNLRLKVEIRLSAHKNYLMSTEQIKKQQNYWHFRLYMI